MFRLLEVVRADADDLAAPISLRTSRRQIVLTDVHAVGVGEDGDVGTVVDDCGYTPCV